MSKEISGDSGVVFNLQKYSVHDGPGIRTLVFLKGCPLKCQWCSNPESQHAYPELLYSASKCIGTAECGYCLQSCSTGAITEGEGKAATNRTLCSNCGSCAKICPAKALENCGKNMTVQQVLDIVEEDSVFYSRSGGGITLSGGEPLLQADFARELLKEAKQRGLDTAIETTGFAKWEDIVKVFEYVDTVHFDIKCLDSEKHKRYTGVSNEEILRNFESVCANFPDLRLIARTPVVPGFNDTEEEVVAISNYIKGMSRYVEYELLGYHRFGEGKYTQLGKKYPFSDVSTLETARLNELKKLAEL